MEIGNKLREARKICQLTQEQAAEALGVSRQTISNWENNKSYPDIISVIKMSDIYSVSLDHLLKEDKSMKQTYQEYLYESTNVVKAKRRLGSILLFSTYFIIWTAAMSVLWLTNGTVNPALNIAFKAILLPLALLICTALLGKNSGSSRWNLLGIVIGGITYLAVPYVKTAADAGNVAVTFCFPNFAYMAVGIAVSACGICIGMLMGKASRRKSDR